MKILFFIDQLQNGGAERVTSVLANELSQYVSLDVSVLTLKDEKVLYTLNTKVHCNTIKRNNKFRPFKIALRLFDIYRYLRTENPDVIISLGYMGVYICILKKFFRIKSKIISSERTDPNREPFSALKRLFRNYCYGASDLLVCQTKEAATYYNKRINAPTKIVLNPISPDLPIWHGVDSLNIVCACRLEQQKNLPMLINAFEIVHAKFPLYKLKIYGQGTLRPMLQSLVTKKHLQDCVAFEGQVNNIKDIFAESFISVLPSDYEGMSNTMIESLGIGIPFICTDCPVGGARMLIENGVNGFITPVGDANAFADTMIFAIEHKSCLQKISNKSREINEFLSVSNICQEWLQIITDEDNN